MDQSIFVGIQDQKICNEITGYLRPPVGQGQRLFCWLSTRDQQSYFWRGFLTRLQLVLHTELQGDWLVLSFSQFFLWNHSIIKLQDRDKFLSSWDTRQLGFFVKAFSMGNNNFFWGLWYGAIGFQCSHFKSHGVLVDFTTGDHLFSSPCVPIIIIRRSLNAVTQVLLRPLKSKQKIRSKTRKN